MSSYLELMSCTLHHTGKNKNIEISGTIIKTEVNQLKVLTQLDHEAHTKTSKNHLKTQIYNSLKTLYLRFSRPDFNVFYL